MMEEERVEKEGFKEVGAVQRSIIFEWAHRHARVMKNDDYLAFLRYLDA